MLEPDTLNEMELLSVTAPAITLLIEELVMLITGVPVTVIDVLPVNAGEAVEPMVIVLVWKLNV